MRISVEFIVTTLQNSEWSQPVFLLEALISVNSCCAFKYLVAVIHIATQHIFSNGITGSHRVRI